MKPGLAKGCGCCVTQGIFRRGLQLEALKDFILSQGASKNVTLQVPSPLSCDVILFRCIQRDQESL